MYSAQQVRKDFPFLKKKTSKGKTLVYLDNAATTQKPVQVLRAIMEYYEEKNANPHRGIYELSEEATEEYESSRAAAAQFVGAESGEIVFVKNATEGMNLIANSLASAFLKPGDRVLISAMEHHANIVPWLLLKQRKGIELDYIELSPDGTKLEENWEKRITAKTKVVSVTHASNVLGTINDVRAICAAAKEKGCYTIIDGAPAAPHLQADVKKIGCDFYAFSGHKMLAPMGIGVVYGRKHLLEEVPPFLGGGDMIRRVERQNAEWNEVPWKFEAGTPNVEGAVGLKAAINYLQKLGLQNVRKHGEEITVYLKIKGGKIVKASFEGQGCAISQASAAMLLESIEGKKLADVLKTGEKDVLKLLGGAITPARLKCAFLGLDALKKSFSEQET